MPSQEKWIIWYRLLSAFAFIGLGAGWEFAVLKQFTRHVFGVTALVLLHGFTVYFLSVAYRLIRHRARNL